jgi:hypothetical protein
MKSIGRILVSLHMGGVLIKPVSAYNWQQHVPPSAKQFIPGESQSLDNPTSPNFGVASLSGRLSISDHYGPLTLQQAEVLSPLSVFGPLTANDTNFNSSLTCHGPVILKGNNKKNVIKGELQVMGPLAAEFITFEAPVIIFGTLQTKNAVFHNTITIHTSELDLKDTEIKELFVEDTQSNPVTLKLENVRVKGKITIASGKGTVIHKNSQVEKTQVTGFAHYEVQ